MNDLTPAASLAWKIAAAEASGARHDLIECVHLVIGVLSLEKVAHDAPSNAGLPRSVMDSGRRESLRLDPVLQRVGLTATDLRRALRAAIGTGSGQVAAGPISRSPALKRAFRRANELAREAPINSLMLLAVMADEPDPLFTRVLTAAGTSAASLARVALAAAKSPEPEPAPDPASAPEASTSAPSGTPEIDRYGRDLTRLAAEGEIGPILGRRHELLQLIQTLARSTKNNPVLVGEAGVGKTAVVEALAIRAAQGKDPAVLGGKRIVELNLGAILGGTQYRGEFEKRLAAIVAEAKAHPEVIVFIDELHTLVGAGQVGEGGMDAAQILKPALARGELRLIGATTISEYRKYIEKDPALERRIEKIDMLEPSRAETIGILEGLRAKWEKHHGVRIEEAALVAAVDLSLRFDADHRLPDKAVDLVDKAAARTRVPMLSMQGPSDPPPSAAPAGATIGTVTERTIALVLAEKMRLPIELVSQSLGGERNARLLKLDGFLRSRLVGQDEAIERVARRLQLAHAGLAERKGPLAVFLFLGPSGVGKTELARLLAEFLFGGRSDLTQFDMSEFMEEHSVSKLIGSPPGYVGHDEEGQLTSKLRSRPYSVVLLDEAEKAHPRIFDLFLQLFDAGRITDAKGRTVDATSAIFVLTSNLGAAAREKLGFGGGVSLPPQAPALEEARRWFRPEFLNRIDEQIVFRLLDRNDAALILEPMLEALARSVEEQHGSKLIFTPEAAAFLVTQGFNASQGARGLERALERHVQGPLSSLMLSGKLTRAAEWRVVYDEGGIYLLPE